MTIRKRPHAGYYSPLYMIPLFTYIMEKLTGSKFRNAEFLWWITIAVMFILSLILRYEITFKDK